MNLPFTEVVEGEDGLTGRKKKPLFPRPWREASFQAREKPKRGERLLPIKIIDGKRIIGQGWGKSNTRSRRELPSK
jgi:hypothetical protein